MTEIAPGIIGQSLPTGYFQETDDEVLFLDPVYGNPLKANEPPKSLLEDPMVALGFDFIRELANEQRITVQLVQGPHGGREDLHDIFRDFGDLLDKSPLVGLEIFWNSQVAITELPELSKVDYVFAEYEGRKEFQKEQLSWAKDKEKIVLPCEFPYDRRSDFGQRYFSIMEQCWDLAKSDSDEDKRIASILYGYYQVVRQWTFISQLGFWLWRLDQQKSLPAGHIVVPIILGGHNSLSKKLTDYVAVPVEKYDVDLAERTLGPLNMSPLYQEVFDDVTAHARITYIQLDMKALIT